MTKRIPKHLKKKVGRKWFDGKNEEDVKSLLRSAAEWCYNREQRCLYAQISTSAYDRYMKAYPVFRAELDMLAHKPDAIAKQNQIRAVHRESKKEATKTDESKWWLEHHVSEEFRKGKDTKVDGKIDFIDWRKSLLGDDTDE